MTEQEEIQQRQYMKDVGAALVTMGLTVRQAKAAMLRCREMVKAGFGRDGRFVALEVFGEAVLGAERECSVVDTRPPVG